MGLALVGDADLFGPRRRKGRRASAKRSLLDWRTLSPGEAVVHIQHGVGIYRGLVRITVSGAERDVIRIEYLGCSLSSPAATDRLERWVAARMRSTRWAAAPCGAPVTCRTKEIARRLLDLRPAKRSGESHPPMRKRPPSIFIYVKFDRGPPAFLPAAGDRPMDHLVVGMSLRQNEWPARGLWAIRRGHQVTLLAPTTILAEQHGPSASAEPLRINPLAPRVPPGQATLAGSRRADSFPVSGPLPGRPFIAG